MVPARAERPKSEYTPDFIFDSSVAWIVKKKTVIPAKIIVLIFWIVDSDDLRNLSN